MSITEKNIGTMNPVGKSVPRLDVLEKVTGSAQYTDDLPFGNSMLFGRVKRSTVAHGIIKRIDVSKAKALPGVKVVVTGHDFPNLCRAIFKR